MKVILAVLLFTSAVFAFESFAPGDGPFDHLSDEEFANLYLMDMSDFDGAKPPKFDKAAFEAEFGENSSFDLREAHPGCVSPIRDQAGCGGCWAFAITSLLSDRDCINNGLSETTFYSPQHLIDCADKDYGASGCKGADTQAVFDFTDLENGPGFRKDSCYPYTSGKSGKEGTCVSDGCTSDEDLHVYATKETSLWYDYDNIAVAKELQEKGTVYFSMIVHSDFRRYKKGIYKKGFLAYALGGHAIRVIGWGNDNGDYYWICANQWNTKWGDNGYFKIKFNEYIGYKAGAATPIGEVNTQETS